MEDPLPNDNDAAELRRREEYLRAQEAQGEAAVNQDLAAAAAAAAGEEGPEGGAPDPWDEHNNNNNNMLDGDNDFNEPLQDFAAVHEPNVQVWNQEAALIEGPKPFRISYTTGSFVVAFGMIFYALRTRQQWYLALVFLTSSKWAYIVLGNAFVALLISIFTGFTKYFYAGLRLHEAEGLGDFFRWNITETCLALTMFRSELNVQTGIHFLILVLAKCLHWVADTRESHLRMTQEAVVEHPRSGWPAIQEPHLRLFVSLVVLQLFDIVAVLHCAKDILENGPTVSMLFAFEGAILLVTVMSSIILWHIHVLDGALHFWHDSSEPGSMMHNWIHPWKDHKATLIFAVEVQAHAAKFLFYLGFFAIVMTYHGLPINLFREVYLSFQALRQRLVAFGKYRQLMSNMNQFSNPKQDELEEAGTTCIICRDEMEIGMSKKLPGCGHMFHKSCLREWLVQQQSCPVCRGDIAAMQARQRLQDQADQRQQEQQRQDDSNNEEQDNNEDDGKSKDGTGTNGPESEKAVSEESKLSATGVSSTPDASRSDTISYAASPLSPTGTRRRSIIKKTPRFQDGSHNNDDDDDRKPAARPFGHEKHVRIIPPHYHSHHDPIRNEGPAFPAFYRVVVDEGASVFNNGEAVSFVIRTVPFGVIVLGQELSWREAEGRGQLMIRVPDGWICDEDVQRVTAVPLDQLDRK